MIYRTIHQLKYFIFFLFFFSQSTTFFAQKIRFAGYYPLCTPDDSKSDLLPELEMTLMAIAGGCKIAADDKTPKRREDPEAFIYNDYKTTLLEMVAYATEIAEKTENSSIKALAKTLGKAIKKKKFSTALNTCMQAKVNTQEDIESIYFIWKTYLYEKEQDVPWLKPINRKVSRLYRKLISSSVKNSKDRPFGVQAQLGGVVADIAQALSNCMENPQMQSWQGEGKIQLSQTDELSRFAADIAYIEWRLNDGVNGRRAYMLDKDAIIKVKQALYDVAAAMNREQKDWYQEAYHGENLQILYNLTFEKGWKVDGTNAIKNIDTSKKNTNRLGMELPSYQRY